MRIELATSSLPRKCSTTELQQQIKPPSNSPERENFPPIGRVGAGFSLKRAEDGTQTRDPQLGRLMLYRLSYFRDLLCQYDNVLIYQFKLHNLIQLVHWHID